MTWSEDEIEILEEMCASGASVSRIAQVLQKSTDSVKSKIYRSGLRRGSSKGIRDILDSQRQNYEIKKSVWESYQNQYTADIGEGPYGILFMGDPHMDDDGCDLDRIDSDFALVSSTPRLFAACLGDLTNNWIGRLAGLYAGQHTTDSDAEEMIEWFVSSVDWLFIVLGNHDKWSPLAARICREYGVRHVPHGGKFTIVSGDSSIKVDAKHNHRGSSMYNPAHAQLMKAFRGSDCDIVVGGHHHKSGYSVLKNPETQKITHAISVGSYKRFDPFAHEKDMPDLTISPSVLCVVDASRPEEGRVTVFHDVELGADFLRWKIAQHSN